MYLHLAQVFLHRGVAVLKLLVGLLELSDLGLKKLDAFWVDLAIAMSVHQFVMAGLELPVVLQHLVELLTESLFVCLHARQLLLRLLDLSLLLVEDALVLRFNLGHSLRGDSVGALRGLELVTHLVDHFLAAAGRPLGLR